MSTEIKTQDELYLASVKAIYDAAAQANTLLNQMQQYAEAAGTTLTGIYADAENAKTAANGAIAGLSTLESLIDTVQWIADHKKASTDTTVNTNKTYYTYDPATGALSKVDPVGTENPSSLGWYELDEAITNYIASRLVETDEGLYVADIGNGWRVLISSGAVPDYPAGVHIIDPNGYTVLSNTASGITLGATYNQYIGSDAAYIVFDKNNGQITIGGNVVFSGNIPLSELISQLNEPHLEISHEYTSSGVTLSAAIYKAGLNVTSEYDPNCFEWYLTKPDGLQFLGYCSSSYQLQIADEDLYDGQTVMCEWTRREDAGLTDENDNLLTDTEEVNLTDQYDNLLTDSSDNTLTGYICGDILTGYTEV